MEHPIHNMLKVSMENIKDMIDVDTIVGEPILIGDKVIVPVSGVKLGFASGGTEQKTSNGSHEMKVPFGGGTGGSLCINPIALLVISGDHVELLHMDNQTHVFEKILEKIPAFFTDSVKEQREEEIIRAYKG